MLDSVFSQKGFKVLRTIFFCVVCSYGLDFYIIKNHHLDLDLKFLESL
jgi:hypothetical protein